MKSHRKIFLDSVEIDKTISVGDIVMTKRVSSIPFLELKKKYYLLLKVKAISPSLKSKEDNSIKWNVIWFEGNHPPLYCNSLILVKRGNINILDVSEFNPFSLV